MLIVLGMTVSLAGCNFSRNSGDAEINETTKFSQAEYQVKSSPRVTKKKKVRKGGGRYQVGKPYKIRGKWYHPSEDPTYVARGEASWYGPNFHGRLTANGEIYDQYALSAAHPTLPLPSYARVTNLENGRSIMVRVNDRGPFSQGRIIDLSARAAEMLDYQRKGVAEVKVEYVGKARMDGRDERFLMASYRAPSGEGIVPGATQTGTMLAMADDLTPLPRELPDEGVVVAQLNVPVPLPRPGMDMRGVPMDVVGAGTVRFASLQPLGYFGRHDDLQTRLMMAFDTVDRGHRRQTPAVHLQADPRMGQAVHLLVGTFASHEAVTQARSRLHDLGLLSERRSRQGEDMGLQLVMMAGGDVAGAMLMTLRARGFSGARILDESRRQIP